MKRQRPYDAAIVKTVPTSGNHEGWHDIIPPRVKRRDGSSGSGIERDLAKYEEVDARRQGRRIANDRELVDDVVTASMAIDKEGKNDSKALIVTTGDNVVRGEDATPAEVKNMKSACPDEREEGELQPEVAGSSEKHGQGRVEGFKDEPRNVDEEAALASASIAVMDVEVGIQSRDSIEQQRTQQIADQEGLEKAQWSLQLSTHSEQIKTEGKEISKGKSKRLWRIGTSNEESPSQQREKSEQAAATSLGATFLRRQDRDKEEDESESQLKQQHDAQLLLSLPDTSLSLSSGVHQHSRRGKHRQSHSHPSQQGPTQTRSLGFTESLSLSPSHSGDSREMQPHSLGQREKEVAGAEREFTRIGVQDIVSEPIPSMARKLQDLPDSFLAALKESLRDMLNSIEKREQFVHLQQTLAARTDFTTDNLLRAHRIQLELLVAVKTGIVAFLHSDLPITHSALVGIFLQQRCRNFACQNALPADECDCTLCAQKAGFCNACMCVVCFKFDFDANTCRWIGCDFCLHWCHTDCGIRMGYIAPGPSIRGVAGTTEMQFRCIACGHTSELYGFVKDVFCTCAPEWGRDVLARELDCVRRIFHGSTDVRGKHLCSTAEMILQQLNSQVDTAVACSSMVKFFDESTSQEAILDQTQLTPVPVETIPASPLAINSRQTSTQLTLEMAKEALATYDRELEQKRQEASGLQQERERKKAQIEELESIVRIKQAEAQMFARRADEVRREAEGLHRIMLAKTDRLEQEYSGKLSKLGMDEAEERYRKHRDMVQVSHQAQMEFQAMSLPLLSELHDLLRQIEASNQH